MTCDPRDRYRAGLERLAQGLEHVAVELRELVEKQRAVVDERNLARRRLRTATDRRDGRRGMLRGAKRALPGKSRLEATGRDGSGLGGG